MATSQHFMKIQKHTSEKTPDYPRAEQFTTAAALLGMAAAATFGTGCSRSTQMKSQPPPQPPPETSAQVKQPKQTEEPTPIASADDLKAGCHDYLYQAKGGQSLREIVTAFYGDEASEKARDAACQQVAAANPELHLSSWNAQVPAGTKLVLPRVSMTECGH